MIDPQDPDFATKIADEMLNALINRLSSEVDLPIVVIHRALLDKAHQLMVAAVNLEIQNDAD